MNPEEYKEPTIPEEEQIKERLEELRKIFRSLIKGKEEIYYGPEMKRFFKEIQAKYTNQELQACLLWHLIILSTPNESVKKLDFPEGEIENFIREKLPEISSHYEAR